MLLSIAVLIFIVAATSALGQSLASLLANAAQAQSHNQLQQAAEGYQEALHLSPQSAEIWSNLGLVQYEQDRYQSSVDSLKKSIQLNPSLYAAQLFLGIDYVQIKMPEKALFHLLQAEKLNAEDPLLWRTLGDAYTQLNSPDLAAQAYSKAIALRPADGQTWFKLGIARINEVNQDSQRMAKSYSGSAYAKALLSHSFFEEGRYGKALEQYQKIVLLHPAPPCMRAQLGFALLHEKDFQQAAGEFESDSKEAAPCSLAILGQSSLSVMLQKNAEALQLLKLVWQKDQSFFIIHLPIFVSSLTPVELKSFQAYLQQADVKNSVPKSFYQLLVPSLAGQAANPPVLQEENGDQPGSTGRKEYEAGHYSACAHIFRANLPTLSLSSLNLLSACAWYSGEYKLASASAVRMKKLDPDNVAALYWSILSNDQLAYSALSRYEQMYPDSARTHLLLGDVYRQRQQYGKAEVEYRFALKDKPDAVAGFYGLAESYLDDGDIPDALKMALQGLRLNPGDPELNLLAGESYIQNHQFLQAEPFLVKALRAKSRMLPYVHLMLGEAYEHEGKTLAAIQAFKQGIAADEDGSYHYQLFMLYRKIGDEKDAASMLKETEQIQRLRH